MPFETVDETVTRQRRIRVCERCRRQLPDKVQNRGAYNTGGSIAGSLGGSMVGSAVLGEVLGPVGMIGGLIGGAMAGSRAGAAASNAACDGVESMADGLCDACKTDASRRPSGTADWGGGRLGDGSSTQSSSAPAANGGYAEQSFGDKASEAASKAGQNASAAAAVAGERLSSAGSWMRSSVSNAWAGSSAQTGSTAGNTAASSGGFKAFQGQGRALGSTDSSTSAAPAPGAAAAARRVQLHNSNLLQGSAAPVTAQASAPAAQQVALQPAPQSQMDEDAALARQLQEQFQLEDQRG